MTIRGGEEKTCECDSCGWEEHSGTRDFKEFVQWLKEQGWKIRKEEDGTWQHFCADCSE